MEVLWFENYNLSDIQTPVKADQLELLLKESGYDRGKTKYLVDGFRYGFSLRYRGVRKNIQRNAPNLPLSIGTETDLWNKVMKEVKLNRYAGPFKKPPFKDYIQSPIGLVEKDGGKDTRLIFHLSYPRDGNSINSEIPEKFCSVKYPDFQEAVILCSAAGEAAFCSKSDAKAAFRQVPLKIRDFKLMLMWARCPIDGQVYHFVDKCLPFGSSISCKIYQDISNGISHIVSHKTKKPNVNYLDDFLFIALLKAVCNLQVDTFIQICQQINLPVALEKTVWAEQFIIFLGLLIDNVNRVICIPLEKIQRAQEMLDKVLQSKKRKATVLTIQRLSGFLNFLCKCIVPGRAFTGRLYSLVSSKLKPHHHVRIPLDVIQDLKLWKKFLDSQYCYCRPFLDFTEWTSEHIQMYSDASKSMKTGFGAYCQNDWMAYKWSDCGNFLIEKDPSICYLELFAVTAAIETWIHRFRNRRITLFCDNDGACKIINNSFSRCRNNMVLVRRIALQEMLYNVRISAEYIETGLNTLADSLSRHQMDRFWKNVHEGMNEYPTKLNDEMWPVNNIWID